MKSYLKLIYVAISLTCGFKLVKCKYVDIPTSSSEYSYNPYPTFISKPKAETPQMIPLYHMPPSYPVYQESIPNYETQYLEENEAESYPKLVIPSTTSKPVTSKPTTTSAKPATKSYSSLPPAVSYQSYNYEIKTEGKEKDLKRHYGYKYEVNDIHSGDHKSVYEKATPEKVEGGYSVIIPGNSAPKQIQTVYKSIYVLPKSDTKFLSLSIPEGYELPYPSLKSVSEKSEE